MKERATVSYRIVRRVQRRDAFPIRRFTPGLVWMTPSVGKGVADECIAFFAVVGRSLAQSIGVRGDLILSDVDYKVNSYTPCF